VDLENVLNSQEFTSLKKSETLEDIYKSVRQIFGENCYQDPNSYIYFSEALKSGQGDCVEKSALFQIAMDYFKRIKNHPLSKRKSFYVVGDVDGGPPSFDNHAFNIVVSEEKNLLVDVQNPSEEGPYIVPVEYNRDINNISVPDEYTFGRTYSL